MTISHDRIQIQQLWESDVGERERRTLRETLTQPLRSIPPIYFYDGEGSRLFDEICGLDEYYQTRTERHILQAIAPAVAAESRAREVLELGSGMATKTRVLLSALHRRGTLQRYVPFDVSLDTVELVARELVAEYEGLHVDGIVGDFVRHLPHLTPTDGRLTVFLGGTIGNFSPEAAREFVRSVGAVTAPGGWFLLGVDRIKSKARLEAAYNDAAGVTARFNLNTLSVVNDRFGGNFDPDCFEHRAFYDEENAWIEMRLVANRAQRVTLETLDLSFDLADGEEIRTEISTKFDRARAEGLLAAGGFAIHEWYSDQQQLFSVVFAQRQG